MPPAIYGYNTSVSLLLDHGFQVGEKTIDMGDSFTSEYLGQNVPERNTCRWLSTIEHTIQCREVTTIQIPLGRGPHPKLPTTDKQAGTELHMPVTALDLCLGTGIPRFFSNEVGRITCQSNSVQCRTESVALL